ncbi:MAG: hypothetical protein IKW74_06460, partial [Thermoguttaceae bacterium]|nr:hypothetical protein [Thermoguttaceae bacterium]
NAEADRMKATIQKNEETIDAISKLPEERQTIGLQDDAKRMSRENVTLKRDLEQLLRKIDQKKAQLSDFVLIEGNKQLNGITYKSAEEYGYKSFERQDNGEVYQCPAIEELIRWRLWNRTGGGLMAELGSHQLDAASIFIAAVHGGKKQFPLSVSATGSRSLFSPLDRDVDDHVSALYEYPAPDYDPNDELGKQRRITVAYSTINGNGFGGYGETVYGTKGTLVIDREKDALLYRTSAVNDKIRVVKSGDTYDIVIADEGDPLSSAIGYQGVYATDVSRGYCEEIEHWAYCIRNNPEAEWNAVDRDVKYIMDYDIRMDPSEPLPVLLTRCRGEVAIWDAIIALVTNIAADLDQTIQFDPEWFDYKSDATPEAAFADQIVERIDGESDADYEKRLAEYKMDNTPHLDRYGL